MNPFAFCIVSLVGHCYPFKYKLLVKLEGFTIKIGSLWIIKKVIKVWGQYLLFERIRSFVNIYHFVIILLLCTWINYIFYGLIKILLNL